MAVKIGLDAGHGLKTAGKQTPDGIKEWSLNDKVCDKIATILKDYDVEIIRVDNNEGNIDEPLVSRVNAYLNAGVSVFVSIHHNAYTGTWNSATGVEVWIDKNPTANDTKLANCIYPKLVKYTGLRGRGIKRENWAVINQNKIPAVLVEGGFMDGSEDYKIIISDAGQTAYAKAVAEGLVEFLGLTKKSATIPATTTSTTSKELYRVRKSWADAASQIGAYSVLDNAKRACKAGYYVFDSKGNVVYPVSAPVSKPTASAPKPSTSTTSTSIAAGTKLNLKNVALYGSSSATTKAATRTGVHYVWSKDVVNNRIRITNSATNVGKSGQITGWISYADAKNSIGGATASSTPVITKPQTSQKSLDDWAREVIRGTHGNGIANRKASLAKAGCPYTFEQVQGKVNQLLK